MSVLGVSYLFSAAATRKPLEKKVIMNLQVIMNLRARPEETKQASKKKENLYQVNQSE